MIAARCTAVVLLAACASDGDDRVLPPATIGFRAYAAAKLGIPASQVDGGPTSELEAAWFPERVGAVWAMTMFPRGDPATAIRGWATQQGTAISIEVNLGVLLVEAGVWGGGVTPALTAREIADRLVWSRGAGHVVLVDLARGAAPPEIVLRDGAGTMTFVDDYREPGPGGAGGGPRRLTRFEIALTQDHGATATQTALPSQLR